MNRHIKMKFMGIFLLSISLTPAKSTETEQFVPIMKSHARHQSEMKVAKDKPIHLNDDQIKEIDKLYETTKTRLPNVKRQSSEFTDVEYSLASMITMISPKSHNAFMEGLCRVFSPQRASALLEALINGF